MKHTYRVKKKIMVFGEKEKRIVYKSSQLNKFCFFVTDELVNGKLNVRIMFFSLV